jgi:uracil-DNA glycosylase
MPYNLQNLINLISTDFKDLLIELYKENTVYFKQIEDFLNKEEIDFNGFAEIYPKIENIFACFDKFNINDTKVVIIGQDPYHGPNQAHGLCFSVNEDIKIPPSLRNIYIEIEDDLECKTNVNHQNGDLTYLAEQGILLLNTSLTVRQSKAGSHAKIWKEFTKLFLEKLNEKTENLVYLLWGNHAKKYKDLVESNNYILEATHPSPLGANKGGWWKCKHFSKTNNILEKLNKNNINW